MSDPIPGEKRCWALHVGDAVEQMRGMPEASVDAIVTDPPYGLSFMGKDWDSLGRQRRYVEREGYADKGVLPGYGRGGTSADREAYHRRQNRAMQAWHEAWAREALRVLKPGGHLLAFGGTRTYHRLACAVEDAGFEIRDSLVWLYGSGFPKSLDASKAIDRAAGVERTEVVGTKLGRPGMAKDGSNQSFDSSVNTYGSGDVLPTDLVAPATPDAERWQGWGTALKPAHEPIVLARKPLAGTVAANVVATGCGALNVDGCRVGLGHDEDRAKLEARTGGTKGFARDGYVGGGRWPANLVLSHAEGCRCVGERKVRGDPRDTGNGRRGGGFADVGADNGDGEPNAPVYGDQTCEDWRCVPGCPVAELDRQSGEVGGQGKASGPTLGKMGTQGIYGGAAGIGDTPFYGDSGGASRFFYCAKASRAERNAGLAGFDGSARQTPMAGRGQAGLRCRACGKWKASGSPCRCPSPDFEQVAFDRPPSANAHPTVKPIDLMRWLVRLVTPPGGTVLDPFTGSGTTGIAAALEGFDFIGVERESEYAKIAQARIAWWAEHPEGVTIEAAIAGERRRAQVADTGQIGMFEDVPDA